MHSQLKEILYKVSQNENIKDSSVEVHDGNKAGEGFLGEITFVTLTDKVSGKAYNLVIKKAFEQEEQRAVNFIRECFLREIYLYTIVWPTFLELQKELLIDSDIIFDKIIKCFFSNTEDRNEYLVLDNAKKLGYDLVSKKYILDTIHLEFIFKKYAQFHSISYVLQQKKPLIFQELKSNVKHIVMKKILSTDDNIKYMENIFSLVKKALLPEDDKECLESKLDKCVENWREYFSESYFENAKFKGIIHGDCWSNNMMFKYDDNGKPKDIKLIDWQLSHYGSPISDLSYCLYSGSNKDQYDQLDRYLEIYYEAFIDNLKSLKYEFSKNPVPALADLKEEWIKYCKYGFIMGLMLIRVKAMSEEEVIGVTEIDPEIGLQLEEEITDVEVNNRFRGLLLHMNEIGAL